MSGFAKSGHRLEEDGNKFLVTSSLGNGNDKQVLAHEHYGAQDSQPQTVFGREGKIAVPGDGNDKQVLSHEHYNAQDSHPQTAFGKEEKVAVPFSGSRGGADDGLIPSEPTETSQQAQEKKRLTRRTKGWIGVLVAIIVLVLVIVLPVTLTRHDISSSSISSPTTSSSPSSSPPRSTGSSVAGPTSTPDPPPFKASNGTGIRNLGPVLSDEQYTFYQDYLGDIKYIKFQQSGGPGGTWSNPTSMNITDAANNTGIYTLFLADNLAQLTYVSKNGSLQSYIGLWNDTSTWRLGTLGSYDFKAPVDSRVGMGALTTSGRFNDTSGCKLYVGGEDGLIHEYSYDIDSREWAEGFVFNQTNGHGGNYLVPNGDLITMYALNSEQQLEFWWMNKTEANDAWPAGNWTRGVTSNVTAIRNSDVRAEENDGFIYFQDETGIVSALRSTNTGEGPSQSWGTTVTGIQGLPGTSIEFRYSQEFGETSAAITKFVYFQTNSSNIAEFSSEDGVLSFLADLPID